MTLLSSTDPAAPYDIHPGSKYRPWFRRQTDIPELQRTSRAVPRERGLPAHGIVVPCPSGRIRDRGMRDARESVGGEPDGMFERASTGCGDLIRDFFLNHPVAELRAQLWELYASWVHQDETATSREHSEMLFLYEHLGSFLDTLEAHGSIPPGQASAS